MEDFRHVNRYIGVILAARRARAFNEGVGLTPEMEGKKITMLALDDYYQGRISMNEEQPEA
jgi:DNA-directed RNA polymerase subunit K/omega